MLDGAGRHRCEAFQEDEKSTGLASYTRIDINYVGME